MTGATRHRQKDGRSARRVLLDEVLTRLVPQMRGAVLEIGNGRRNRRGNFAPPTAFVERWTFVDRERDRAPHLCADVAELPFAAGAFDTVVCLEVLEYVAQPAASFAEIARVLRPGGTAILSTPFNTRPDTDTDLWRFTANGLRRLATRANLDVTQLLQQGTVPSVALHMFRSWHGGSAWRRRAAAFLMAPLFDADLRTAAGHVDPLGYTTGYVLVARKPGGRGGTS
jgi:SAM-dependent methyltransferase